MSNSIFDVKGRECPLIFGEPCPGASIAERPGGCAWWRDTWVKIVKWEGKNRVESREKWTGCGVLMRDELELGVAQEVHAAWQAVDDMVRSVQGVRNVIAGTQLGLAKAMKLKLDEIQEGIREGDEATIMGRDLISLDAVPIENGAPVAGRILETGEKER